jgi:hypothetical protein
MDAEKIQSDIDALLTYMNDDMENLERRSKLFHLDLIWTRTIALLLTSGFTGLKSICSKSSTSAIPFSST